MQTGHHVELVTGKNPELRPRTPGVQLRPILPSWRPPMIGPRPLRKALRVLRVIPHLESWRRVAAHIARSRPDVVQLAELRFAVDGAIVAWLAGRRRAPVVVDVVHEPRPVSHHRAHGALHRQGTLLRLGLGAAYRRVDAVFVLGERAAVTMRRSWPTVRRVEVMPHGDEDIFAALATAPVPPVDACPPRILFFGTWTRYKGLDLLLDAFALVRTRLPEAELVIAGRADNDVDVDELLARAAAIGGVDPRPGYVPATAVAALMGSCRVVVAPYRTAAQSGVVHLAQTFARPVVATDVGDLGAAVRHDDTGLLVAADDAEGLAQALERLLRDPAGAARMGRNARHRLTAEASWTQVAARVTPVYEELVGVACPQRLLEGTP